MSTHIIRGRLLRVLLAFAVMLAMLPPYTEAIAGMGWTEVDAPSGIVVTSHADRSSPEAIEQTPLAGDVFIFMDVARNVREVSYFLDDPQAKNSPWRVSRAQPFDLEGSAGELARPFDTTTLDDGVYTLTGHLELANRRVQVIHARVVVFNEDGSATESEPEPDPEPDPTPDPDPQPEQDAPGDPNPVDPALATHTVPRSMHAADCERNLSDVQPGDVVAIESGDRKHLRIVNCHGTADAPIVFVNDGGVVNIVDSTSVYAGLDIRESSYIRVSGSGAADGRGRTVGAPYPEGDQDAGIRISGTQRGVAFKYAAFFNDTHPAGGVLVQGLEIDHIEAGPTSKNGFHGPENDRLDQRYTVVGFRLHHNYVHDNHLQPLGDGEGFYLGATRYSRHDRARTGDMEVDHNLVARTGRDGIQLGSAWYGTNSFHHNVVYGPGQGDNQDSFCFIFNRGTTGDMHSNYCFDAGRDGIRIQGLMKHRIYNNVLARGGHFSNSSARGIRISHNRGDAPAAHLPDADWVKLWNNTVVGFPDEAIYLAKVSGNANEVRNNIMYGNGGTWGLSNSNVNPSQITASHNHTSDPQFEDADSDDYRLRPGSPAIDAGLSLPGMVDFDVAGRPRPQGKGWDIGANEYFHEGASW